MDTNRIVCACMYLYYTHTRIFYIQLVCHFPIYSEASQHCITNCLARTATVISDKNRLYNIDMFRFIVRNVLKSEILKKITYSPMYLKSRYKLDSPTAWSQVKIYKQETRRIYLQSRHRPI